MDPALQELLDATAPAGEESALILRLAEGHEAPDGVRLISRFGPIATCRVPNERIYEVWSDDAVASLKAPRLLGCDPSVEGSPPPSGWREPTETSPHLGGGLAAPPPPPRRATGRPVSGRGVAVAAIDFGLDFVHPHFRKRDGSTRLLALWDQSKASDAGRENRYGYGVIHRRAAIDRALRSEDPYAALGYHPAASDARGRGAHGTHVLDIAAGSGRLPGSSPGLASGADLIFVQLATRGTSGLADLGDSVRLLEALDFIACTAGERPWVVNVSLGRMGGCHKGKSLVEQAMDQLLTAAPGRAICQSNGNYRASRTHAEGRVLPGEARVLGWIIETADATPNELEVWYSGADTLGVEIAAPGGAAVVKAALGERASIRVGEREVGRIYHRACDPNNCDHHIDIFLFPEAPAGRWQVTLEAVDGVDGRFHAWIERDPTSQSRFATSDASPNSTTGTICNGLRPLVVGAYDAASPDRALAPFSSVGPTRDNRFKPDLIAPGVRVLAARSTPRGAPPGSGLLVEQSGTSMATPHVTGTVALVFEAAGRKLTVAETRNVILGSAERAVGKDPHRVGAGYLNIDAALESVEKLTLPEIEEAHMRKKASVPRPESRTAEAPDLFAEAGATPTLLFDALAGGRAAGLTREAVSRFEVIASPGERLSRPLEAGDFLLWRALGEGDLGGAEWLADGELIEASALPRGRRSPGRYAALRPTRTSGAVGRLRRLTDEHGRVPHGVLVLRLRDASPAAELWTEVGEAAFDEPAQTFEDDTFEYDTSEDGTFEDGTFEDGTFEDGTFEDGTFEGVAFEDSGFDADPTLAEARPTTFTAARFQGDPRLFDSLNNRQLIRRGAVGPHVTTIQQALIDLGYSLSGHGVDGRYFGETAKAVRRFQKDQRKINPAFKVDGIVGSQTLGRLDEIFAVLDRPCGAPAVGIVDPTAGGRFQVGTGTYTGATTPTSLVDGTTVLNVLGNVFYPAAAPGAGVPVHPTAGGGGALPVVFLAHGNHSRFHDPAPGFRGRERGVDPGGWTRIRSHEGYLELQRTLATLGIVSVSVDGHDTNNFGLSRENILDRTRLIMEAMRHFQAQAAAGSGTIFEGRLDFSRVALLGQSRGGEAVVCLPSFIAHPAIGVPGVTVRSIFSLAPTDTNILAAPAPGIPFLTLLPAADGDVAFNDGARFYDQTASPLKAQLYVHQTNHNFFNTEWVRSEWQSPWFAGPPPIPRLEPPLMSTAEHRRILNVYAAALYRHTLLGTSLSEILTGREAPPNLRNDQVQISAQIAAALTVDAHENGDIRFNSLGKETVDAGTLTAREVAFSQPVGFAPSTTFFGNTHGMVATTVAPLGTFRSPLTGETDLRGREVWVRVAEVYDGTAVPPGPSSFQVGLEDARGVVAFIPAGDLARPFDRRAADLVRSGDDLTKTMLATHRFPADCYRLARPTLDLSRIRAIILRLNLADGRELAFDQLQIVTV